jgi:DsbC/DsbD-like thiol-disulfide interchange protein
VCSSVCLPGKAHLGMDIDVVRGPLPAPPLVGALGAAVTNLPKPLPAEMTATVVGDSKQILLTLKTGGHEEDAAFYPFDASVIANAADQQVETHARRHTPAADARAGLHCAACDAARHCGAERDRSV